MVFFSDLLHKEVITAENSPLGILWDILFINDIIPTISNVIVEKDRQFLSYQVSGFRVCRNKIIISPKQTSNNTQNTVSVRDNLLDKQIIDLVGNKVIRANDVAFVEKPQCMVTGVDISISGILRRIGIDDIVQIIFHFFGKAFEPSILSWNDIQHLEINKGQIHIKSLAEKLDKIHPEDLADYLETTGIRNIAHFLSSLPMENAGEVFGSLSLSYQSALLRKFPPIFSAKIIEIMDPDEGADVLLTIEKHQYDQILSQMKERYRASVKRLMELSGTPVGELMTTEFFAVDSQMTAYDIQKLIRVKTEEFSSLITIFVTNKDGMLVGVFSLHELLTQMPQTPAFKFMFQEPISITLETPFTMVIKRLLRYKLSVLPVIDKKKKILGIVSIDDFSDYLMTKI